MSMPVKVKISAYAVCSGTYALIFSGVGSRSLYMVAAIAYAIIACAEARH